MFYLTKVCTEISPLFSMYIGKPSTYSFLTYKKRTFVIYLWKKLPLNIHVWLNLCKKESLNTHIKHVFQWIYIFEHFSNNFNCKFPKNCIHLHFLDILVKNTSEYSKIPPNIQTAGILVYLRQRILTKITNKIILLATIGQNY